MRRSLDARRLGHPEDRSLVRWPEPHLPISADRGSGLVLVRTTYTIAAEKEQQFLQAMARLRQSRLRTGATGWALYQDGQDPRLFIELFAVPSWEEHLRQHRDRQTGTDLHYHDDAAALSDPQPQTGHYLAIDVRELARAQITTPLGLLAPFAVCAPFPETAVAPAAASAARVSRARSRYSHPRLVRENRENLYAGRPWCMSSAWV
jgi:hypothetical protein